MNLSSLICRSLLTLAALPLLHPLQADEATAWNMVNRANKCADTRPGMEEAFILLYDAYSEADKESTRQSIQNRLNALDTRYNEHINNHYPLFLDKAYEDDFSLKFYKRRANYEDARGMRLYGEYLINQNDKTGWDYMAKAAAKYEPRALYNMACRHKNGEDGGEQSPAKAYHYLKLSAQQGYAPAYEMLAQVCWDGDANFGSGLWDQKQALSHLDEAIRLYSWNMGDENLQASLTSMLDKLRHVRTSMANISSGEFSFTGGFYPNYTALKLASIIDTTEDGLRARAHLLCHMMEEFGGTYLTDTFHLAQLEYVPINITRCPDGSWVGLCTAVHDSQEDTYAYRIDIDISRLPAKPHQSAPMADWYAQFFSREMELINTLAHELAHGYFRSRYPEIAKFSDEDRMLTYEGHATQAACAVIRTLYYNGSTESLPPERYAAMFCSPDYTRYFNWFLNNCMSPSGRVFWDKINRWERNAGQESYEPHLLRQVPWEGQTYWKPEYFGLGFQGYM